MSQKNTFYITTPIYYVNDKPHLGHAYTTIACDVMARFKRLDGFDTYFLTGTDEHGQKVQQAAEAKGIEPQAFTDEVSLTFRNLWPLLNITNDDFIRTTEERHKVACQALWKRLVESGDIYLDTYGGWYAVRDEAYYGEDELTDGPNGKKIAPSGAECEWVEEESYFFKLSAWGDRLLEFYEKNPNFIQPDTRKNEVISFVKSGLRDLSVSRTRLTWGVPVPDAPGHVMYVWIDALTNYISALGFPDEKADLYQKYWPGVHMVGKDILRFHAVYWPAFLMAAKLPVPERVFAHGWWTREGQKMSKSLGNVIAPSDLIETYGLDQSRYFLLREVPFGSDGDFSHAQAVTRINSELANGFGNLAQRTLSFVAKNCEGKVPACGDLTADDKALLKEAYETLVPGIRREFDRFAFHKGLEHFSKVVNAANAYIDVQAPWGLKKTDTVRMETVLWVLLETIRCLAIAIQCVTPDSASKMLDQLSIPADKRNYAHAAAEHSLVAGTSLPAPAGVFPRIQPTEEKAA
ncbi:MAG: methionine--tRNA ligase [Micavibrio aeruginosavorus]|uniref:Methionine--tRNA ligase n=1 Tax=Micavibrio aeruginosavorus TaxID=349221 RepID=A0A2W4ZL34_9BACT|nr:MAG: methionine--tRNA ligase [Micavibrio aeruginosavorus]